ncbi:MAG: DUF4367 domain-containing protein [Ruminococcus sp.]|nr:DUF4367 domain-containing protein [Ruminococcus sp.]
MDELSIAVQELFDEQTAGLLRDIASSEEHIFSQKHEKKMQRLFKRQRKPYFKLVCTAGRRAVCIAAALVIVSASAMSVKAVRETIFDFITSVFSDHQVITADSDSCSGYPSTIKEEYRITKLPEGFEQQYYNKTDTRVDIPYYSTSSRILFTQFTKDSFRIIFTDDAKAQEYTDTDGQKYQIVVTECETVYIWDNGRYVFMVSGDLDKETMLELCRSVKPHSEQSHQTE